MKLCPFWEINGSKLNYAIVLGCIGYVNTSIDCEAMYYAILMVDMCTERTHPVRTENLTVRLSIVCIVEILFELQGNRSFLSGADEKNHYHHLILPLLE